MFLSLPQLFNFDLLSRQKILAGLMLGHRGAFHALTPEGVWKTTPPPRFYFFRIL